MNTIAKNKIIKDDVLARGSEIEGAQAINMTRPLLKWAGGKTQLLGEIIPKIPRKYGRFIEPFFGGGAVFFAVTAKLSDARALYV